MTASQISNIVDNAIKTFSNMNGLETAYYWVQIISPVITIVGIIAVLIQIKLNRDATKAAQKAAEAATTQAEQSAMQLEQVKIQSEQTVEQLRLAREQIELMKVSVKSDIQSKRLSSMPFFRLGHTKWQQDRIVYNLKNEGNGPAFNLVLNASFIGSAIFKCPILNKEQSEEIPYNLVGRQGRYEVTLLFTDYYGDEYYLVWKVSENGTGKVTFDLQGPPKLNGTD